MVRVFVALELPEEIRNRLAEVQEELRRCAARLTFVDPALIHITLKFIGEVSEKDIPRVCESLRGVAYHPFPATIGAVTVNNPKRPFTVWATVKDGGMGADLFCQVENALSPLGIRKETRPFTPHATLARVRSPDPSLFTSLRALPCPEYGSCVIAGLKLKKSTLTPRGPLYEDLMEVVW